ncbi:MAG: alcohol dehydrogenase catalytic domain-containing protein [Deltaproteobacteria bacterium]|nr:alcohol dehydrogenase catalytic domain-containing protein [Deltaproteobacteria bacterium]
MTPTTMRAGVLDENLTVRIAELEVPTQGRGELLVRTRACGICSGDVMGWYMRRKAPLVFGHEPAGEVAAVGPDVEGFRPGDRVFVHHHAPCFACDLCARGEFVQCEEWRVGRLVPGGMAEYFVVPSANVRGDTLHLPDSVSFTDASLIEPLACTVKSLRRAGLRGGERVVVIGLGIMGQLHVVLARHAGARQIIGLDRVPFRLARARALGADAVIHVDERDPIETVHALTAGARADVVIVGPGSIEAMELGLALAGRGASVVLFTASRPEERLSVQPYDLYFREIRLVPSYSCGPNDTRDALDLITRRVVTAAQVVTHEFPLAEIAQAYRTAADAGAALKTVVTFP